MAAIDAIRIEELSATAYQAELPGLAALLFEAVDSGASVNLLA